MCDLKPCPFCGGVATFVTNPNRAYKHYVCCRECEAEAGGSAFENNEYNAEKWNKRHAPDEYTNKQEMNERIIKAVSTARKRWAKSDLDLDGYALVPLKPTEEMIKRSNWSGNGDVSVNEDWARVTVYQRMITAYLNEKNGENQ